MPTGSRWCAASDDALEWIRQKAIFDGGAGYAVGPMPDKIYLLHPFEERVDGKRVKLSETNEFYQPDHATAPLRPIRWDEYARRRGIAGPVASIQNLDRYSPLGEDVENDDFVWPPSEGSIDNTATQEALFEVLIRHTTGGDAAQCTAFFYGFGVNDGAPLIMRGPLGAWRELFNRDDRMFSPQNIWPDSHEWVLDTDTDEWKTAISGSVELVDALLAAPRLEAIRLPSADT